MTQKAKITVFAVGFVAIVVVFWLVMFRSTSVDYTLVNREPKSFEQVLNDLVSEEAKVQVGSRPIVRNIQQKRQTNPTKEAEDELRNFVRNFVERFGTYSNMTDFSSVLSLKSDMVKESQGFVDDYVKDIKRKYPYRSGYYGVTTLAPSVNPINFTLLADRVEVEVSTRRQVTSDSDSDSSVYTQKVEVVAVKRGDEWKIKSIYWK